MQKREASGGGLDVGVKKQLKSDNQVEGCNKQGERNAPYCVYDGAHIRNSFFLQMINSPAVEETTELMRCFDNSNKVQ